MKKKILLFAIVLITIFAAVSCSYTFDAVIGNSINNLITYSSNEQTVSKGIVYLFTNEEAANDAYEKLRSNQTFSSIEGYLGYDNYADIVNGIYHINYSWISSAPTGGKDQDVINIWLLATDCGETHDVRNVSRVRPTNCTSDKGINSVDLTLYPVI